jgi:cell division septation protein DedD
MFRRSTLLTSLLLLIPGAARAQRAAVGPDSVQLARAQTLAAAGNGAAARALVDSVLATRTEGTNDYAEALYWRGMLAATAADAERAYLSLGVEYPLSPRSADALLRLAQLESARGDRTSARRHLERLVRDHPIGSADPRAGLWAAKLLFDESDAPDACAVLALARAGVSSGDVELTNQIDYEQQRCVGVSASASSTDASSSSTPPRATAPARAPARAAEKRPEAPGGTQSRRSGPGTTTRASASYSVQIAAYRTRSDADALAARLKRRGYDARVVGEAAPYRVRVGSFATRAGAVEMQRILERGKIDGIVVDADGASSRDASKPAATKKTPRRK